MIVTVAASAALAVAAPEQSPPGPLLDPTRHREVETDAYLPRDPTARIEEPIHRPRAVGTLAAPVQINVDADGLNIPQDAANEPSFAVDPTAPNRLIVGWRQFDTRSSSFRQAGVAYSHDGGRTWTSPGPLQPGIFRSDPVLDAAPDGTIFYSSLFGNFQNDLFLSNDGGVTWSTPRPAWGGDKQWIAVDECEGKGRNHVFAAWSIFAGCCGNETFIRSFDDGATFPPPIEILETPIFGTMAQGPEGALYIAGVLGGDFTQFGVAKSSNAVNPDETPTWDQAVPVDLGGRMVLGQGTNPNGLLGQAWIDVDRSDGPHRGNLYLLGSVLPDGPDPMDIMLARSVDGGLSWSAPLRINDDEPGAYNWFGALDVAPNGRVDVVWFDVRDDTLHDTWSALYYAWSDDGGATFSDNVQLTDVFNHHKGYPVQQKIGDYFQVRSDRVGAHVVFPATWNNEQDLYYVRIGDYDCNDNGVADTEDIALGTSGDCDGSGVPDACEIAAGTLSDLDGDGIPDECGLPGDVTGDGLVDVADLLAVIGAWGPCPGCPEDIDGDGSVGVSDLLTVLAGWS